MYLKRLEIKGFKSFADSTEICLEPGTNVIVGPNGCGKSNVVDAIRWVLGESNIRHLRGQKNEDVIFNGTDKKKALGMALVEMTVDNTDHSLPVAFEEISLSRKIFRSGESEFYINKSRVRMKDIVNLFTGTGLGKKGYSIISQGELEQVLNGQPFDRRLILEEAAGIIKYRQQRDEVQSRISSTANDLLRLGDILSELEGRKIELSIKAEKAANFLKMRDELNSLEKQALAWEIRELTKNLGFRNQELQLKKDSLAQLTLKFKEINRHQEKEEGTLDKQRNLLGEQKEKKYTVETSLKSMESEIKLSQERIHNYQERIEAAVSDSEKYQHMLENLDKDLLNKIDDYNNEKEKYSIRSREVEELASETMQMEQAIADKLELFEKQRGLVFERANMESRVKNDIVENEDRIKKTREKIERLSIHIDDNDNKVKGWKEQIKVLEDEKKLKNRQMQEQQNTVAVTSRQQAELAENKSSLDNIINENNKEIMSLENKLLSLQELENNFTGYSEGVKGILQAYQRGEKTLRGIKGLMANLINVPSGMEEAIDTAAGRSLENIVVETSVQAHEAINYLKKNRLGRVTFLPLETLRVQKLPPGIIDRVGKFEGVLGLASQLVQYEAEYEKAVEYLLGRVLVVDSLKNGMQVFKNTQYPLRIVSLEGELINVSGAMTGGSQANKRISPLKLRGEGKRIRQQLDKLRQTRDINQTKLNKLMLEIKDLQEQLSAAKNNLSESEFQVVMIQGEINKLAANQDDTLANNQLQIKEKDQLHSYIQELEIRIVDLHREYENICNENSSFSEEIERIKATLEIERRDYEVRKERILSHQEQLEMKKKELDNSEKNLAQFQDVKRSYQESALEAQELRGKLQKEIEIQMGNISQTSERIKEKRRDLDKLTKDISKTQQASREHNEALDNIRKQSLPLQQEISSIEDIIHSIDMKVVRMDTELEVLQDKWQEKFSLADIDSFTSILSQAQLRDTKRRIDNLRDEIELLGPVDIEAIKEYEEVQQRFDFLKKQNMDLSSARDALEKLLLETEKIMVQDFNKFFSLANESFNRTFVEIFSGGEACLEILAPGSDSLAAGIDIVVKMPGKKNQSLHLLSGGERALTCIAFIFSLLRLKPAPFCLLDEIDASLDETNLIRFTNFLKTISENTQFIVITHRQATIEAGETIYGVTMPQEGVSSVLSVCFPDDDSMAG